MPKELNDVRIASARSRLASHIGELQERMTRAREMVSPTSYLKSPWLTVGGGIVLGLLVGRRRAPLQLTDGTAPASSGILRAAAIATATSLVRVMIERAARELLNSSADPPRGSDAPG